MQVEKEREVWGLRVMLTPQTEINRKNFNLVKYSMTFPVEITSRFGLKADKKRFAIRDLQHTLLL